MIPRAPSIRRRSKSSPRTAAEAQLALNFAGYAIEVPIGRFLRPDVTVQEFTPSVCMTNVQVVNLLSTVSAPQTEVVAQAEDDARQLYEEAVEPEDANQRSEDTE